MSYPPPQGYYPPQGGYPPGYQPPWPAGYGQPPQPAPHRYGPGYPDPAYPAPGQPAYQPTPTSQPNPILSPQARFGFSADMAAMNAQLSADMAAMNAQMAGMMSAQMTGLGQLSAQMGGMLSNQMKDAQNLSAQMAGMNLQQPIDRAGDTKLLSLFKAGGVVVLTSCASGKTLRINKDGHVEGCGGHGAYAQFTVHVRRPGVVALQNVHNPNYWLAVYQGNTVGTGNGACYCEFLINEIEGRYVCLESVMSPGQYVGVLPGGQIKPPANTRTGPHGRFTVSVKSATTTNKPARPSVSPADRILSMFAEGKVVILQSNASRLCLRITDGDVDGKGARGAAAQFTVHMRRPGVVALQNVADPDNWLAIFQGTTVGTGKGEEYSDFKLSVTDGKFVCLESVKSPGQFVGVLPDGSMKSPAETSTGPHGKFIPSLHK